MLADWSCNLPRAAPITMIELTQIAVANSRPQAGREPLQSATTTTTTTGRVAIELQVRLSAKSWLAHKRQRQVEADEMNERQRQRARTRIECEQRQVPMTEFESEFSEERSSEPEQQPLRGRVMGPQLKCDEKFDASSRSGPSTEHRNEHNEAFPFARASQSSRGSGPAPQLALYIKKHQTERVNLIALLSLLALGLGAFSGRPAPLPHWNKKFDCDHRVRATCDTNGNHRNSFILFASAEGAPEIGSHRSYRRRNQQISTKTSRNMELDEPAVKISNIPIPEYTQRPEPNLRLREGSSQLLRCATKEKMKNNYWMKDGSMLFDIEMKSSDAVKAARFQFVGDMARNDYTIELRNAQVEDSGNYECHSYTKLPDKADHLFLVASNVTVEPIPPITQSPSALASLANDHNIEVSTQQQQLQHSQRSTVLTQSFQSESTLQPANLIQVPAQVRDMTRLVSANRLHRNSSTTSLKVDPRYSMPFVWPYVLLALAAILMLTNVYLIYSLIRRHTRRRRSDVESPSRERKLSSSSSSGVGSGSGQGSTSVHRLTK